MQIFEVDCVAHANNSVFILLLLVKKIVLAFLSPPIHASGVIWPFTIPVCGSVMDSIPAKDFRSECGV